MNYVLKNQIKWKQATYTLEKLHYNIHNGSLFLYVSCSFVYHGHCFLVSSVTFCLWNNGHHILCRNTKKNLCISLRQQMGKSHLSYVFKQSVKDSSTCLNSPSKLLCFECITVLKQLTLLLYISLLNLVHLKVFTPLNLFGSFILSKFWMQDFYL